MTLPFMEKCFEIWNDGYHYKIGLDPDGLEGIEIGYYEDDPGKPAHRVTFSKEEAVLLRDALTHLLAEEPKP